MHSPVNPTPRYYQVYLLLRQKILEGRWPAGTPMPGEHELAASHGVSRITIRNALSRLADEGLITRRRGAGTFVRPLRPSRRRDNLRGLFQNLVAMGERTEVRLLAFSYVPAPPEIAERLRIAAGSIVQKSVRIRLSDGVPFSHLTTWLPEEIGRHFRPEDLGTRPMLALLREAGFAPDRAEQVISCKLADIDIAEHLQVAPASALLWGRRQVRDASGRPVEYIEALYRPDRYEYKIDLVAEGDGWSQLASGPER